MTDHAFDTNWRAIPMRGSKRSTDLPAKYFTGGDIKVTSFLAVFVDVCRRHLLLANPSLFG
jgi:hypothetical protein